jgi:hypothetical protein
MSNVETCFSQSYQEAREKFLTAARAAGAAVHCLEHPDRRGATGETLALDVARIGPAEGSGAILISSGTHGVEGFCGSGCQVAMLWDDIARRVPADCALILAHAVNPHGFSWLRRVNEDNVDCNRNFVEHGVRRPNLAYDEVHERLVPDDWDGPARVAADAAIAAYIANRGVQAWQAAVTGGQYVHPDGLFYGGDGPVWSNHAFRRVLREHARGFRDLVFIDLHTGLGPSGHGEAIYIGKGGGAEHERAVSVFGQDVTSIDQGTSSSAVVTGVLADAVREELPDSRITALALEYGTHPLERVLAALRADNWLHMRGDPSSNAGREISRETRSAFYVDEPGWKQSVTGRALEILERAKGFLGATASEVAA